MLARPMNKSMTSPVSVLRWTAGEKPARQHDEIVIEEPLEIQVDTRPVVVTMRTPGNDDELAAGFLFTEGLIRRRKDILKIAPYRRNEFGNVLDVFLAPGVAVDFAQLERQSYASSSCGLCGRTSIESVHRHFKQVKSRLTLSANVLATLPARLREKQPAFDRTGGLHAAAIFNARGRLLVLREDVGRHNAVDKVIGHALLNGLLPCSRHVLMVSGRASFEILQKALAARIPFVAAVSAPSSLAVEFAAASGQTLVGFLRGDRMNVYSRPARIVYRTRASG